MLAGYVSPSLSVRKRRLLWVAFAIGSFMYGAIYAIYGTYILMQLAIPLILMAAAIIWLLPDTERAPLTALEKLLFAFVIALICWPNYLALALPGMPWVTAIRLIAAPLAIVMLVCVSVSARFRGEMATILSAIPALWKLMVAFMVIALLSIGLSAQPSASLNKFIVAMLYWTLIFFASVYVFAKKGKMRTFAYVLWGCLLFVALIGAWEWKDQSVPWAGHVPSFLKVDDETLQKMLTSRGRAATGLYRVKSVFTTALGLAEFMALATPFVLHILITSKKSYIKAAAFLTIPFIFYILTKTDSRLGMVGFFMTFLLYLLAWGAIKWRSRADSIVGPAVVLSYPAVFSAFIAATFFVRRLEVMVWGSGATKASTEAREAQIAAGIPEIFSQPWGQGIGQGAATLGFTNQAGVLTIDTYLLVVGLEFGVIGFVVFCSLFIVAGLQGTKHALLAHDEDTAMLTPLVIALANFFIIKSIFAQESNHPLAFAMLGMIVALTYRVKLRQKEEAKPQILAPLKRDDPALSLARARTPAPIREVT